MGYKTYNIAAHDIMNNLYLTADTRTLDELLNRGHTDRCRASDGRKKLQ